MNCHFNIWKRSSCSVRFQKRRYQKCFTVHTTRQKVLADLCSAVKCRGNFLMREMASENLAVIQPHLGHKERSLALFPPIVFSDVQPSFQVNRVRTIFPEIPVFSLWKWVRGFLSQSHCQLKDLLLLKWMWSEWKKLFPQTSLNLASKVSPCQPYLDDFHNFESEVGEYYYFPAALGSWSRHLLSAKCSSLQPFWEVLTQSRYNPELVLQRYRWRAQLVGQHHKGL